MALIFSGWKVEESEGLAAQFVFSVTIFRISEPPRESWVALSWIDELTLNATCVVDHVYPQPAVEMSLVQVALRRPRQPPSEPSSPSQIGGGGGDGGSSFVQTIKT